VKNRTSPPKRILRIERVPRTYLSPVKPAAHGGPKDVEAEIATVRFERFLASDVMERRREKAIENREWFPQDRSTEAARMQELTAHFYDELVRAEQESFKAMAAGSHRSSFKVGVSESAEHLSSTIGEWFRALRSGKSKPREG
jgi:hypothetical protein